MKNAVEKFSGVFHAYCFRHVMNNFNTKFKDDGLKKVSWRLEKATCSRDYDAAKLEIPSQAFQWLANVGLQHITTLLSPVCRFSTLTSNNVESTNSRLKEIRSLPILDAQLQIEKMVMTDFFESYKEGSKWNSKLTKFCEVKLQMMTLLFQKFSYSQTSENNFVVWAPTSGASFHVSTSDGGSCSCGEPFALRMPCVHLLLIIQQMELDILHYCDKSWQAETYLAAYEPFNQSFHLTTIEDLSTNKLLPPLLRTARGRPRKKRIESQKATLDLEKPTRQYRCSRCKSSEHRVSRCQLLVD